MADLQKSLGEATLIQTYFAPLTTGAPGAYGLLDDCASLTPPDDMDLVLSTDAVVEGVHFLANEDPDAIAQKALGANVSDIVAKGARPLVYLMNLSLPSMPSQSWLESFTAGLGSAQSHYGCHLTGGDTDKTPGPMSVSITMIGVVARGQMVRRSTAKPGDVVFVTGPIGDATLGLCIARNATFRNTNGLSKDHTATLEAKYRRPQPDGAVGDVLVGRASAAMDVSDGLIKDFGHMCAASGCGGRLELGRMPISDAAKVVLNAGGITRIDLATGGEDYVVLGSVAQDKLSDLTRAADQEGITVTPIGQIRSAEEGVQIMDETGKIVSVVQSGWDHFSNSLGETL